MKSSMFSLGLRVWSDKEFLLTNKYNTWLKLSRDSKQSSDKLFTFSNLKTLSVFILLPIKLRKRYIEKKRFIIYITNFVTREFSDSIVKPLL